MESLYDRRKVPPSRSSSIIRLFRDLLRIAACEVEAHIGKGIFKLLDVQDII